MEEDISINEKIEVIEKELSESKRSRFLLEVRYRIHKKVGSPKEILENITSALEKQELFILALEEEIKSLIS